MSYIRNLSPHTYVEGISEDYVYPTQNKKGEFWIEDYGGMKNETIVELMIRQAKQDDNDLILLMAQRLARNLNIKLRQKPLTSKQWLEESNKIHEEFRKKRERRLTKEVGK